MMVVVVVVGSTRAPPGSSPKDGVYSSRREPDSWNGIDWERGGKEDNQCEKGNGNEKSWIPSANRK